MDSCTGHWTSDFQSIYTSEEVPSGCGTKTKGLNVFLDVYTTLAYYKTSISMLCYFYNSQQSSPKREVWRLITSY